MLLSEQIRMGRERRGWSQEELAERIGVNVSTVGHWESGRHEPGPYYRLKLHALGILHAEPHPERKRMENEQTGTYFVSPQDSQEENRRLDVQSQIVGRAQGGSLPEQADPGAFRCVLDIGCGTGNWLIDVAGDYPEIRELVGVDISQSRIAFAREMAARAGVENRVRFQVMDAILGLSESDFPDEYFDLVNVRFAMSWLRVLPTDNAWLRLLAKIRRVLRPGGTIRLVETQMERANMPAFNRFWDLGIAGARQSGHITDEIESIAELFPHLLDTAGFSHIQRREIETVYRSGDPDFSQLVESKRLLVRNSEDHLTKWLHVTDYPKLAEYIYRELDDPGFELTWTIITAWGVK